nr:IS3 family transposase [Citreicella sp. C3M06]
MALMQLIGRQLIDRQFLETPFYGVQEVTRHLQSEGHAVNLMRIRRLMRPMPIYRKLNTSKPAKGRCPCLLAGLRVDRPNQFLPSGSCCA